MNTKSNGARVLRMEVSGLNCRQSKLRQPEDKGCRNQVGIDEIPHLDTCAHTACVNVGS